jgi:FkbM family methyltransferase
MFAQKVKTLLLGIFGEKAVAILQAVRFVFLIRTEEFLDPEVALLPHLVGRGDVVVDVGANGANWTYWLHRAVGDSGAVYAFEADPYYAFATDLAIKLMRLRGVHLFSFGLSNEDEKAPLVITGTDGLRMSGMSYIDRNADQGQGQQIVQLRRLDSLVENYPRLNTVKLIKCDVEGYELFVFRGAAAILDQARPSVILEIGHYEMHGYSAADMFAFFAARGYVSFAMIGEGVLTRTDNKLECEHALSVNRLMIPEEQLMDLSQRLRVID